MSAIPVGPASKHHSQVPKRALDLTFCLLAVVPMLLLGLVCAVAIKLDSPGPVVFSQKRTGRNGVPFKMLKFRTMVRDAEELKASLYHLNILPPPDFKIPDDPRVTRVGRILRKTSLDELPQILNVMRGDMSLVGPRPTSFAPDTWRLWHTRRLDVRPGLTGLWQLYGRNTTTFDERLRLDIEYVNTCSVWRDLRIIAATVPAVLRGAGQ